MRRKGASIAYFTFLFTAKGFTRRFTTHNGVILCSKQKMRTSFNFLYTSFGLGANLVGFPRMT